MLKSIASILFANRRTEPSNIPRRSGLRLQRVVINSLTKPITVAARSANDFRSIASADPSAGRREAIVGEQTTSNKVGRSERAASSQHDAEEQRKRATQEASS